MKKTFTLRATACLTLVLLSILTSCKKSPLDVPATTTTGTKTGNVKLATKSITPYIFNWETVDWMPTPAGQTQIPPPWIGQGSIASTYGIDVVNDHKASDGWVLIYNTFDPNASGSLINPYFILYNKFRGLMRVYLYTTGTFVFPSTYIVDGLSVVSNGPSNMLNFLGSDVIDPTAHNTSYSQIEPAPKDGSQPLASNKWYMLQYEIAYDPATVTHSSDNMQLSWFVNFNSVSSISLGGTETGTIKSPAGAAGSGISTALQNAGTTVGTATLAVVGQEALNGLGNSETGVNTVGLSNNTFKEIVKGIASTINSAAGGIPGAIYGIFSAIFGGNSSSPTINANFNSTIKLQGTQTSSGSFPSSPTSVYVPGTSISPVAQNFIPLYNSTLGVFNLTDKPTIVAHVFMKTRPDQTYTYNVTYSLNTDNAYAFFVSNPDIINGNSSGATIMNVTLEPIIIDPVSLNVVPGTGRVDNIAGRSVLVSTQDLTDTNVSISTVDSPSSWYGIHTIDRVAVRVVLTIRPNSAPQTPVTIVKTFAANLDIQYDN